MTDLEHVIIQGQGWVWQAFIIFLRVAAVLSLAPGFGERSFPMRMKLAAAFCVTVVLVPLVPQPIAVPETAGMVFRFIGTETLNGLLMGIGLRLFILALQTAGSIAAQSTSLSQILGATAEPMPAMGHLLMIGGIAFAMTEGFHVQLLSYLLSSYELLPAGYMPASTIVTEWGLQQVAQAFVLAFQLAGPFVIVSLLYNLMLGAINRGMPQLMVAFVGAPAITIGGLVLLAILSGPMLILWVNSLQAFANAPAGVRP